jgi:hypothetical protein
VEKTHKKRGSLNREATPRVEICKEGGNEKRGVFAIGRGASSAPASRRQGQVGKARKGR